jgi:biotin carboxyl carrier protein
VELLAPVGGQVVAVRVKVGDRVAEDQELFTIDALKMQMPIYAESPGIVKEVRAERGRVVSQGDVLAVIE